MSKHLTTYSPIYVQVSLGNIMTEFDFSQLSNLVQDIGIWILFAYLYLQEKKAHQATREQYRADLREIAGMRQALGRVQSYVRDTKTVPVVSEMADVS